VGVLAHHTARITYTGRNKKPPTIHIGRAKATVTWTPPKAISTGETTRQLNSSSAPNRMGPRRSADSPTAAPTIEHVRNRAIRRFVGALCSRVFRQNGITEASFRSHGIRINQRTGQVTAMHRAFGRVAESDRRACCLTSNKDERPVRK